jgi:hypothetical protein
MNSSTNKHRYQIALPFILLCLIFFIVSRFNKPKRAPQNGSEEIKLCIYADCSVEDSGKHEIIKD